MMPQIEVPKLWTPGRRGDRRVRHCAPPPPPPAGFGVQLQGQNYLVTPAQVPGLVGWWRADLGVTLNGSTVSAWADQSGAGNNVSQGVTGNQPTFNASDAHFNGAPSFTYNGTSSVLTAATLSPTLAGLTTIAAVYFASTANTLVMGTPSSASMGIDGGAWYIFRGTVHVGSTASTGLHMLAATTTNASSSSSYFYVDSSASPVISAANVGGSANMNSINVGGETSFYLNGAIAEAMLFNIILPANIVGQLFRYMAGRYGGTAY